MREEPYLAFLLKEANDPTIDKQKFLGPLLTACLLSKHIQIIIPIAGSISHLIDRVFDGLFISRPKLFKEFVATSKGIVYARDLIPGEKSEVLKYAAFVITTDKQISQVARSKKLPCAYISQCEDIEPEIIVLGYEGFKERCFNHGLIEALRGYYQL